MPAYLFADKHFLDLRIKNDVDIDFQRSEVGIRKFGRNNDFDIYWKANHIMNWVCHRGFVPDLGHCQACLLSAGNIWMSDDDCAP